MIAFKMPNDIVISYAEFIVELKDTYKNSKIKHHYKKVKNDNLTVIANLFDLNLSGTLFFDDKHFYTKNNETLGICEARKYDLKKYSVRKKLKKIRPKYIDETFKIINENINKSFDYFKNLDDNLSNSNKTRNRFLNEHPDFEDNLDKISPEEDFTLYCPFCEELTQKSAIHCHNCGLNLEKTLIRNENKNNLVSVKDTDFIKYDNDEYFSEINPYDLELQNNIYRSESLFDDDDFKLDLDKDEMEKHFEEIRSIFDSEDEMKAAFSKILETTGELALISHELQDDSLESLENIDFEYLELDRNQYDSKKDEELNIEKSMYALVKYANEHPTPWMYDYYLKSIDRKSFDWIIEKEYITKVMPDKFPELFKDCTAEELIRESESYHDPSTTKEDMINYFMDLCDYSWVVSEKGMNYLKAHPFLDFFTNNLIEFNIYEFKLYSDKYKDELTLEEIGDKYINAKFKKALDINELNLYLNYVDYYFSLNLAKNDYETAFIYLIQRIIYEINIWHLKEYHFAFDEALSIRTDYLLFKIIKLNLDFDLEKLYDEAYYSLKIDKIKFNYLENYDNLKRLMTGEDVFDISGDLLDQAKEQGMFKSLYKNEIIR